MRIEGAECKSIKPCFNDGNLNYQLTIKNHTEMTCFENETKKIYKITGATEVKLITLMI